MASIYHKIGQIKGRQRIFWQDFGFEKQKGYYCQASPFPRSIVTPDGNPLPAFKARRAG
jgi:hypothetical protein